MGTSDPVKHKRVARALAGSVVLGLVLSGCKGVPVKGEKEARQQVRSEAASYRPNGQRPALPLLTTNSSLADFLGYALLNQPKVEAAYFDWVSSVERITVERSLPDPQLTFQMDIQDIVTSLMPGLMMSFPGAGKLRAAGAMAAADSQAKYFGFKAASLESAFELKRAYYQLYFLEEKLRVNRENLGLLGQLEQLARAQNEVGKATLQDVLRAQIEQERLKNELLNLEDSRDSLLAQFKAALGLQADAPAPPLPQRLETTSLELTWDRMFATAVANNTRLKAMEADVHTAEASLTLAHKARMPDTSLGLMADAKMSPVMYRPWGTVSLPIWRDKLAAQVAEAQARKQAGEARLSAEQISLAVDFAQRSFLYREASRNVELLQHQLLPRQQQALAVARSGYLAGQIDFLNLTEAEQTLLRLRLDEVEARTQRELVLTELSLMVQGMPPAGTSMAPLASPALPPAKKAMGGMGSGGGAMLPGGSTPPKKEGGVNQGGMNQMK